MSQEKLVEQLKMMKSQLESILAELESPQSEPASTKSITVPNDKQDSVEVLEQEEKMQESSVEQQRLEEKDEGDEEEIPVVGKEGVFDGVFLLTEDEKKYQLPPNYISKSMLIPGDRLKIVGIDETGSRYNFKLMTQVERKEIQGILTKKDNQWAIISPEDNSTIYYVVPAAVRYYGGDIGDKATVVIPAEEVPVPVEWGALKAIEVADINKESPMNRNSVSSAGGGTSRAQVGSAVSETKETMPEVVSKEQPTAPKVAQVARQVATSSQPSPNPTPAQSELNNEQQNNTVGNDSGGEIKTGQEVAVAGEVATGDLNEGELVVQDDTGWELR